MNYSSGQKFRYTLEQKQAIGAVIPKGAWAALSIVVLEAFADLYLSSCKESLNSPDRKWLESKRQSESDILRHVQTLIDRDETIDRLFDIDSFDSRMYASEAIAEKLCQIFLAGKISTYTIQREFAKLALVRLIDRYEKPSNEEKLKDNRKNKKHRNDFIKNSAETWARLKHVALADCEISAVEGSPMLVFLQAALGPVLALTGRGIEAERIKQIVNDLRKRSRSSVRIEAE